MTRESGDSIVMEEDWVIESEASLPTISPAAGHDMSWTLGVEGCDTWRGLDLSFPTVEQGKHAASSVGQYLGTGSRSEDAGWSTAIGSAQSPLNSQILQELPGKGEALLMNAHASSPRPLATPREVMKAEASGFFQTEDHERSSPSGHQISKYAFPLRANQDTSKQQHYVKGTTNIPFTLEYQKRIPARRNFSPSSLEFPSGSSSTTSSFKTPESKDSNASGTFSSPSVGPSTPLGKAPSIRRKIFDKAVLEENAIAIESGTGSENGQRPLPMICWHKANGIDCKDKIGRNEKCKDLLRSDHSMSFNTRNSTNKRKDDDINHHTRWPCQYCPRSFDSEKALTEHRDKDPVCINSRLQKSGLVNRETQQTGVSPDASPDRMHEIRRAMEAYGRSGTLPKEFKGKESALQEWVARNIDNYRGESNETVKTANTELGKWFIGWYMFFPQTLIPNNPFVSCLRKNSRVLQLLKKYLEADIESGNMDPLESSTITRILYRVEAAMDLAELEEAIIENKARPLKTRKKNDGNSTNPLSSPGLVAQPESSPPIQIQSSAIGDRSSSWSVGGLSTPLEGSPNALRISKLKRGSGPLFPHPTKRRITSAPDRLGSSPSKEIDTGVCDNESSSTNVTQRSGTEFANLPQATQPVDFQQADHSDMLPASDPFTDEVLEEWSRNLDLDYPWNE